MHRPKPQPKDTQLPRLRSASRSERGDQTERIHKTAGGSTPRVTALKNFRLRNVERE
jgi:hypothetical protein